MDNQQENITIGKPDSILFVAVIFLLGVGIIMVYSACMLNGTDNVFIKQIISLCISVAMLIGFSFINHNILIKYKTYILLLSIILLSLVFIPPFKAELNDAKRWINLGITTFQPSEFAKIGLIIYLASAISSKGENIRNFARGYLPLLIVTFLMFALILVEPDFSVAILLLIVAFFMFYIGGIKILHIILSVVFIVPVLLGLILFAGNRLNRLIGSFDPFAYSNSLGYQSIKFMKALANGGLFGMGFGNGVEKYSIPYAINDSIFGVIAEEIGLIGSIIIILFYVLFAYRGYLIAFNAPTKSSRLLAFGLTSLIVVQTLINLSVVTGWLPITGMTLPFISYGGTSLIMVSICAGILLNISKYKIKQGKMNNDDE